MPSISLFGTPLNWNAVAEMDAATGAVAAADGVAGQGDRQVSFCCGAEPWCQVCSFNIFLQKHSKEEAKAAHHCLPWLLSLFVHFAWQSCRALARQL